MAKHEKRTRPGGEQGHSVLDGPEYIEGVPQQERREQTSARRRDECDSALDGPECIEGVAEKRRKQERHAPGRQDPRRK